MRTFTQEDINNIELGGYALLPTYFLDGTIGKELAIDAVKVISNENIIAKEKLDELVFLCFSNGAKLAPMTVILPKESFQYMENFRKTTEEILAQGMGKRQLYQALLILHLNNIIGVYPEEAFENNLVVDRSMHFGLPPVTSTINFIELIVDLLENDKPAFISFINYQDSRIEQILTSKVKNIVDKESELSKELEDSKTKIEQLNVQNEQLLNKNEELVNENKMTIEKNKASIITVVSLIAAIIPFFIVNISVLVNSFNIILLLCINGIMCLIISVVYFFVNRIINESIKTSIKPFVCLIIIGSILLVLGIVIWILAATIPTIKEFILLMKF